MSSENFRVRRATLDDIAGLTSVWSAMRFAPEDLAKRITEFQVAEKQPGPHNWGHRASDSRKSKAGFTAKASWILPRRKLFGPLLWDRLNSNRHQSRPAPLVDTRRCAVLEPQRDESRRSRGTGKAALVWRPIGGKWLTIKLRDDLDSVLSADAEFALFMQAEKERTRRTFQQARVLKLWRSPWRWAFWWS